MSDNCEIARLAADVVAFAHPDEGLHVLLIQRRWPPYEGRWALPGGHVDSGEDVRAAGIRELSEETGLSVNSADVELAGVYSEPGRDPRGRYVTWAWTTVLTQPPATTAGDDARAADWYPLVDAVEDPDRLAFDHHRVLLDAVSRVGLVDELVHQLQLARRSDDLIDLVRSWHLRD